MHIKNWTYPVKEFKKPLNLPILSNFLYLDGLWPTSKGLLYWSYAITVLIIVNFLIIGEIYFTIENWGDIPKTCTAVATIMTGFHIVLKKAFMLMTKKQYCALFNRFASEIWVSPVEDNTVWESERELKLSYFISIETILVVTAYNCVPLILTWNEEYEDKLFPLSISYPFNVFSPYTYEVFYILNIITTGSAMAMLIGYDSILNYFLIHTVKRFKNLSKDIIAMTNNEDLSQMELSDKLRSVIDRHINLISFVKELEEYFSFNIFVHFFTSSFLLCVLGIQLLYGNRNIGDMMKSALYILAGLGQMFVNSVSGEKLIAASLNFGQAVYDIKWNSKNFDVELRKSVIMMMQRGQTPLSLTGLKFFPLSLDVFSTICRASASYFALLKSLIEQN